MRPTETFEYPDLQNIIIVLADTQTSGNVGAVARVMKNFGLSTLRLVRPQCDHVNEEALWMAVHSEDVLKRAEVFSTIHDAIADCEFSVATTNRRRESHFPAFTPKEIADQVHPFKLSQKIALVFGGEKNGLSTEDIHTCRVISTILTGKEQSSINLSHAVMILAYEIFQSKLSSNPNFVWDLAKPEQIEQVYIRIQRVLEKIEFQPRKTNEDFILGLRRILGRTPIEDRDVRLIQKIFQEIERFVDRKKPNF